MHNAQALNKARDLWQRASHGRRDQRSKPQAR